MRIHSDASSPEDRLLPHRDGGISASTRRVGEDWERSLKGALLAAALGVEWKLADPRGPDDLLEVAGMNDPLAQSRLWQALYPELPRGFLVSTCLVESGCREPIGIHVIDALLGPSSWRGVWGRSRVDHDCPYYPDPDLAAPEFLASAATRGAHGLNASFHIFLIGDCLPLDALDMPFFSGWAAAESASKICAGLRSRGKQCTTERLRCGWARARLGSSACGRVIKRWRAALARRRAEQPDLNPHERWSLARLRDLKDAP